MPRLFIGIETGADVAQGGARLIDDLRVRARVMSPDAKITWVAPERLHVTVRFIGQVDDALALTIQRALEPPFEVAPFSLIIRGVGAFPPRGRPKVIWAGVADGHDAIVAIERAVAARLLPIVGPAEEREYRPHLTLARVREAGRLRARELLAGLDEHHVGSARVEAVTLFESRLSPKGPAYVPLVRGVLGKG